MLEHLLEDLLYQRGIVVHSINGRAKTRKSLSGKLKKIDASYEKLIDITDLSGLRIITYFSEDVDRIAEIIEEEFDIDHENSVDKRRSLAVDRFGYLSLHHVFSLKSNRCDLPENKAFRGLKAELQTRSILQHAWAEIEHDLGYKSAVGVPQPVQRRFARVASLLELADDEFKGIKEELEKYREHLPKDVRDNPEDVLLNLDSLQTIVKNDPSVKRIDEKISALAELKLGKSPGNLESYLSNFQSLGFETIGQLLSALRKNEELILVFVKKWINTSSWHDEKPSMANVPLGISLFYLRLLELSLRDEKEVEALYGSYKGFDRTFKHLITIAAEARQELAETSKTL